MSQRARGNVEGILGSLVLGRGWIEGLLASLWCIGIWALLWVAVLWGVVSPLSRFVAASRPPAVVQQVARQAPLAQSAP